MKRSAIDLEIEKEFAHVARLREIKKKLAILKKKEEEKPEEPSPPSKITYRAIKRIYVSGWPLVHLVSSDGREPKVSQTRYSKIVRDGRLIGNKIPKELPKPLKEATPPPGFFAVQCGDDRVQIVYSLNNGWDELLCFHHRLQCTLHLKRSDLYPKKKVDEIVAFLQKLDRIQP